MDSECRTVVVHKHTDDVIISTSPIVVVSCYPTEMCASSSPPPRISQRKGKIMYPFSFNFFIFFIHLLVFFFESFPQCALASLHTERVEDHAQIGKSCEFHCFALSFSLAHIAVDSFSFLPPSINWRQSEFGEWKVVIQSSIRYCVKASLGQFDLFEQVTISS